MSAHAVESEREKAIATGCDEFDAKPIEFESLVGTISARACEPQIRWLGPADPWKQPLWAVRIVCEGLAPDAGPSRGDCRTFRIECASRSAVKAKG
jgi:hypothetical protein